MPKTCVQAQRKMSSARRLSNWSKTSDGLQRISANLKYARYTKEKIEAQKKSAAVGRKRIKKLELQLIKSGLISQDNRSL